MTDDDWGGEVGRAYDRGADVYADAFRSTEAEQSVDLAMIELFATMLGESARVLDAGCGAGRLLPVLARFGCRPEGIDLSERMIARARRDHPGYPVTAGSLTEVPYPDDSVDGVLAWYSLIHAPDDAIPAIADEFHRVLPVGGLILLAFQTGSGIRDMAPAFAARGVEMTLTRRLRTVDEIARRFTVAAFTEVARLDRCPVGAERDGQGVWIGRRER